MNTKYKTIYFDFFGTLVVYVPGNYFKNKRKKTYQFLIKNGLHASYDDWEQVYTHTFQSLEKKAKKTLIEVHSYDMMLDALTRLLKVKPEEKLIEKAVNIYLKEWCEDVYALDGIHELLEYLSSKYELAIVSNTHFPELVNYNLRKLKMEKYFSHITTSIAFGKRKPDASIYKEALEKSNVVVSESLFIGDSYEEDYLGAKGIKMDSLLIDPFDKHALPPKERIKTILDLNLLL